jgi:hypothetical protein
LRPQCGMPRSKLEVSTVQHGRFPAPAICTRAAQTIIAERPCRQCLVSASAERRPQSIERAAVWLMVGAPGPRFSRTPDAAALHFSDEEKDMLPALAQPIDQHLRTEFLTAVAAELEANGQAGAVGIGSVHRVARTVQRRFFRSSATAQREQSGARIECETTRTPCRTSAFPRSRSSVSLAADAAARTSPGSWNSRALFSRNAVQRRDDQVDHSRLTSSHERSCCSLACLSGHLRHSLLPRERQAGQGRARATAPSLGLTSWVRFIRHPPQ